MWLKAESDHWRQPQSGDGCVGRNSRTGTPCKISNSLTAMGMFLALPAVHAFVADREILIDAVPGVGRATGSKAPTVSGNDLRSWSSSNGSRTVSQTVSEKPGGHECREVCNLANRPFRVGAAADRDQGR